MNRSIQPATALEAHFYHGSSTSRVGLPSSAEFTSAGEFALTQ